jgi:hypothetical protein
MDERDGVDGMMTIDGLDYKRRWSILLEALELMDDYPQHMNRILRFVLDELDMDGWEEMERMWEAWLEVFNEEEAEVVRAEFKRLMEDE